jgi:peptidoglycan endopeptidase LytF
VASILQGNDLGRGRRLYAGQILTIPILAGKQAKQAKAQAGTPRNTIVRDNPNKYLVKDGDTLWDIASAYGVSIAEIKRTNDLRSNRVYAGRWLKIPSHASLAEGDGAKPAARQAYTGYTVRRGDNLYSIADRLNTTIEDLKEVNNLRSNRLYPGMRLKVPSKSSSDTRYAETGIRKSTDPEYDVYTVRPGDTLYRIAKTFEIAMEELARWNNIDLRAPLYPGDKLRIYSK